jgi:hypothetical protein
VPNEGSAVDRGRHPFCISPETAGWGRKCETGRCHGEAVRSVLAKVQGDVFARFHAVAAKRRSLTRNSQFWPVGTGASRYHNCCIDGGTSPEYVGYHLVFLKSVSCVFIEDANLVRLLNKSDVMCCVYRTTKLHVTTQSLAR